MRPWGASVAVLVLLGVAATARAENRALDVQLFTPPAARGTTLWLDHPGVPRHLTLQAGLVLSYALDPLVRADGSRTTSVVRELVEADALLALGLFELLEVGAAMPVTFGRVPDDALAEQLEYSSRFRAGDLRLSLKAHLLRGPDGGGLSARLVMSIPTGGDYAGARSWSAAPEVVVARRFGRLTLGGNLGYRLRQRSALGALEQDDELFAGVGLAWLAAEPLEVTADLSARAGLGGRTLRTNEVPVEAGVGVRWRVARGVWIEAGAGTGLTSGYGTPTVRGIAGLRVATERQPCPTGPEDYDGYQDADFCADPDNDRDGLPDVADACPNDAEDDDDFEDADGCPDPDNDADGVADTRDTCPSQPEDRDGYQDDDGCPEPDNDGDGIADLADDCPMDPEDLDHFEDDDGCPEPGPQAATVTVTDTRILVSERIYFDYDSDTIRSVSLPLLGQVADVIRTLAPGRRVRIEGYTDGQGDAEYNLDLSFRRARAVLEYLVARGIARSRLDSVGYGESRPVADDSTPAGQALNRRVEFTILDAPQEASHETVEPSGAPDRHHRRRVRGRAPER